MHLVEWVKDLLGIIPKRLQLEDSDKIASGKSQCYIYFSKNQIKSDVIFRTVKRLLDGGELADLFLRLAPYLARNRNEAVEEPKTEEGNAVGT